MSYLFRLLIVYFVVNWLLQQTNHVPELWKRIRQNPRWQVIQDELQGVGDDALDWAVEALHERRMRE